MPPKKKENWSSWITHIKNLPKFKDQTSLKEEQERIEALQKKNEKILQQLEESSRRLDAKRTFYSTRAPARTPVYTSQRNASERRTMSKENKNSNQSNHSFSKLEELSDGSLSDGSLVRYSDNGSKPRKRRIKKKSKKKSKRRNNRKSKRRNKKKSKRRNNRKRNTKKRRR